MAARENMKEWSSGKIVRELGTQDGLDFIRTLPREARIVEAPSSVDRTTNEAYQADLERITPGETVRLKDTLQIETSPELVVETPSGATKPAGRLGPSWRYTPTETGTFVVRTADGREVESFDVEAGAGNAGGETIGSPSEWTNVDDSPDVDASDVPGVVGADNPDGAALAPVAREQGIDVDDVGATATIDGTTVEIVEDGVVEAGDTRIDVDPVTDPDEMLDSGSSSSSSNDVGPESGSGMIGAVGGGLLIVLAAVAALLAGGD